MFSKAFIHRQYATALSILLSLVIVPAACAKNQNFVKNSIIVNAPPEYVFQAIRKQRDDASRGRSTVSYDGKVAKVDDKMQGVAIYGKVHSLWQEVETPYTQVDYSMLSSDHFKSATGHWILTAAPDKKSTTLESQILMDSGLRIPFADAITRNNLNNDSKERLARLKKWAEDDYNNGVPIQAPAVK
jgi:hypothetical protein